MTHKMSKLTEGQKIMQFALANFLVDHYRGNALQRRMQLSKMREIISQADQRADPVDDAEDRELDDPRHGQAAAINRRDDK